MKFQDPSMHGLKVMLCIKKRNGRTHTGTGTQTSQKQYASLFFSKLGAKNKPELRADNSV